MQGDTAGQALSLTPLWVLLSLHFPRYLPPCVSSKCRKRRLPVLYLYYSQTRLSKHSAGVCFWGSQDRGCRPSSQTSDLVPRGG